MDQLALLGLDKLIFVLTAFFDGLIAPIRTVSGFVAHLTHFNTLAAATFELFWSITLSHYGKMCKKTKRNNELSLLACNIL